MSTKIKESFEDYLTLFNSGVPIRNMSALKNQTYLIFSKSKYDIRVIDRRKSIKLLANLTKIEHFIAGDSNYFYMIPIQTIKGSIVGFIFRSLLSSNYASVLRNNLESLKDEVPKLPNMFGFLDFKNFDESKEYPIIFCEGMKDAMVIKQFYPYVLSNNTNQMGISAYVIRNLTSRILLSYDNDEAGDSGFSNDRRTLVDLGAFVDRIDIPEAYKDISDWYFSEGIEPIKKQVKLKVKYLMSN